MEFASNTARKSLAIAAVGASDKSILIDSASVSVDECVVVCEEDNFYCSELKEKVCFIASCKVIHETHANN